jgi:hypothetical protein
LDAYRLAVDALVTADIDLDTGTLSTLLAGWAARLEDEFEAAVGVVVTANQPSLATGADRITVGALVLTALLLDARSRLADSTGRAVLGRTQFPTAVRRGLAGSNLVLGALGVAERAFVGAIRRCALTHGRVTRPSVRAHRLAAPFEAPVAVVIVALLDGLRVLAARLRPRGTQVVAGVILLDTRASLTDRPLRRTLEFLAPDRATADLDALQDRLVFTADQVRGRRVAGWLAIVGVFAGVRRIPIVLRGWIRWAAGEHQTSHQQSSHSRENSSKIC